MIARLITPFLDQVFLDTPVVLLNGSRQTGKSTLVQEIVSRKKDFRYVTLDDASVLSAARSDAAGLFSGFDGPVVIDEIQRALELFPAIKAVVDRHRQPARLLVTGFADVLLLPRIFESLAGRTEILTLWLFFRGRLLKSKKHSSTICFPELC